MTPEPQCVFPVRPGTDRSTDWKAASIPWKRVRVSKLYPQEEFTPGSSYGRNAWNELYKGESVRKLYVRLPEEWVEQYNLIVHHGLSQMVVLQYAAPAFAKPRKHDEVGLMNYYRWLGVG